MNNNDVIQENNSCSKESNQTDGCKEKNPSEQFLEDLQMEQREQM